MTTSGIRSRWQPLPFGGMSIFFLATVALTLRFAFVRQFNCTCGHLGRDALSLTVPVTAMTWAAMVLSRYRAWWWRGYFVVAAVLCTWPLTVNLLDVLWFGHKPVW